MREFLNWCLEHSELIKDVLKLLLSAASFLFAYLIHRGSKKRLTELEMKEEVKEDLIKSIQELQDALERSKKNG